MKKALNAFGRLRHTYTGLQKKPLTFLLSISARGGYILLPVLIKLQIDFGNRYSVENIDYQTIRKHRRLVLLTTVAIAGGVKAHLEKLA